jgi:hypothetical protein
MQIGYAELLPPVAYIQQILNFDAQQQLQQQNMHQLQLMHSPLAWHGFVC